jgi:adenylate kinase
MTFLKYLVMIGPPGSGKGTYGKMLATAAREVVGGGRTTATLKSTQKEGVLITASDVLRKDESFLTKMNKGELIGDADVISAVSVALKREEDAMLRILDGCPRTAGQAEALFASSNDKGPIALHVDVPQEICMAKLQGRRSCAKCGGSYNLSDVDDAPWRMPAILPPPTGSGVCGECASNLIERHDDAEAEVTRKRFEIFNENLPAILDVFEKRGRLITWKPYEGMKSMPDLIRRLSDINEQGKL